MEDRIKQLAEDIEVVSNRVHEISKAHNESFASLYEKVKIIAEINNKLRSEIKERDLIYLTEINRLSVKVEKANKQ